MPKLINLKIVMFEMGILIASLSTRYQTAKGIILESLKSIGQF